MVVDGILAGVENDVDNEYISDINLTPILSSFSVNLSTLEITLDLSLTPVPFDDNSVTVYFGNV